MPASTYSAGRVDPVGHRGVRRGHLDRQDDATKPSAASSRSAARRRVA
ncbi:hypothetical protein [Streptomyces sp. NPDC002221]